MKTDAYTKIVLTVIAACLLMLVVQHAGSIIQPVKGSQEQGAANHFARVPVNADGSNDVRVQGTGKIMDVNVVRVSGNSAREGLPIKPGQHSLNINVEEVGGYQVYGAIPVKNK